MDFITKVVELSDIFAFLSFVKLVVTTTDLHTFGKVKCITFYLFLDLKHIIDKFVI